jgi:iron complex transport system substrate-binding protein
MMKLILVALFASSTALAQTTLRETDDAGHTLQLPRPARRVISLAPSVTELLYEAGGGDRLVGTVEYSDYPPQALEVPRIGSNQKLDQERIAALRPDLILIWFHGNALREVVQLTALGIPGFFLEPRHIGDIPHALERIGRLLATDKIAQAAATRFAARYADLRARYATRSPVRVFYQIAADPLLTISDKHIIADAIRACGGRNVFGSEKALVPQLSTESVVAANPDVILTARMPPDKNAKSSIDTATRSPGEPSLKIWARFSGIKAVKTGQLWLIPGDQISRQGPRILDGVEAICGALDEARKVK